MMLTGTDSNFHFPEQQGNIFILNLEPKRDPHLRSVVIKQGLVRRWKASVLSVYTTFVCVHTRLGGLVSCGTASFVENFFQMFLKFVWNFIIKCLEAFEKKNPIPVLGIPIPIRIQRSKIYVIPIPLAIPFKIQKAKLRVLSIDFSHKIISKWLWKGKKSPWEMVNLKVL